MEHVQSPNRGLSIPLWFGILSLVSTFGLGFLLNSASLESLIDFVCGCVIGIIGFVLAKQMQEDEKQRRQVKAGKILSIVGIIFSAVMCVTWLIENI